MKKEYVEDNTIFLTLSGSRAYGTSTPTSDYDYRGVCIIPDKSLYFGTGLNKFSQMDKGFEDDRVIYDIRKFMSLAMDNNPNIIEFLFTDEQHHIINTEWFKRIISHRNKFLSKNIKYKFSGYAFAQLKRIKRHRGYLMNPPNKKPERSDFNLPERNLISSDSMGAFQWLIASLLRGTVDYLNISEELREELKDVNYIGAVQKGIPDECWVEIQKLTGASDVWIETMMREKAYVNALNEWNAYQTWKNNRNKSRAELEQRFGYDCYSDDTEFLTSNGWKLFDDINSDDMLATIKPMSKIDDDAILEYQFPTEKFDGSFNGNMYNFFGTHYDTLVTPNHRMLYQKQERKSGHRYEWQLNTAASVPDTFNFIRTITPKKSNYSNDEFFNGISISQVSFMRLAGWFVSDGTMGMRNGKPKDVRISQKSGGKLHWHMSRFANLNNKFSSLYKYNKKPNEFNSNEIVECILSVRDKNIVNKMYSDFTDGCGNKRLPRWVFGLSKRLMEACLDAMMLGDGTCSRSDNSMIYYSKSKSLANDMNELAFMCGFETSLYGPYNGNGIEMYQVHINKNRTRFKRFIRSSNLKKIRVLNKRVVCFSVPNGTLVTRRNGHIAIHGNCKHAMHLARLMRMGMEILETGQVHVFRPDREELCAIRDGAWTYEQIVEYADECEIKLEELHKITKLPKQPNRTFIDSLCVDIIEEYITQNK